jgi:hypothetical protein
MLIFGCVDNIYAAHEGPVTLKKTHGTFILSVSFRVPSQWIFAEPRPSCNVRSEPQPRAKAQGQATTPSLFPDLVCIILLAIYSLL